MELDVINKTSKNQKRPLIRKGYYPAKLLNITPYNDQDGNLKEGKYGHQLIFEFLIYNQKAETGIATTPMTYIPDKEQPNISKDVVISKFVYHMYKNQKSGELESAVTPLSAITKVLTSLGWEFSGEKVDLDQFLNKFVEVNIDDYSKTLTDGSISISSTIKDLNVYQPKNEQVTVTKIKVSNKKLSKEQNKKLEELTKLREQGLLTEEGFKQAEEQLRKQ